MTAIYSPWFILLCIGAGLVYAFVLYKKKGPWSEQINKLLEQGLSGYDFGCNDPILQEFCQPECKIKRTSKITAESIYTINEARDRYVEYIKQLKKRKINLGFRELDEKLRGIAPGEVLQVMARTGVGKTAFVLNVIKNVIEKQNIPILFFSLEQPLAQIYERSVQIASKLSGQEIETAYFLKEEYEVLSILAKEVYKDFKIL